MCTGPSYWPDVGIQRTHKCWCAACVPAISCWCLCHSIISHAGQRRILCSLSRVQWIHLGCDGDRGSSSVAWSPDRFVVRTHHHESLGPVGLVGVADLDPIGWFHHRSVGCPNRHCRRPRFVLIVLDVLPNRFDDRLCKGSQASSSVLERIRAEGSVVPRVVSLSSVPSGSSFFGLLVSMHPR